MKVRLYRGPHDGKIIAIDDREKTWVVEALADPANFYSDDLAQVRTVKSVYNRTPHTHPDGSVYFEWDRPKGTKSGVRSNRRPKRISSQPYYYQGGNVSTSATTFTISVPPTGLVIP